MIPSSSTLVKAINWQTLWKNNTCIILYRECLYGILRILDFGNEFSVAFINLGARLYNYTLVVSLRDDRVVKKPWRYQRKPRKDSLKCGNLGLPVQVPVLAHLWGRLFFTRKIRMCSTKILKPLMIPLNSTLIRALNWQTLWKNKKYIILCREGLHGIQRKSDFGDRFSVVFTN